MESHSLDSPPSRRRTSDKIPPCAAGASRHEAGTHGCFERGPGERHRLAYRPPSGRDLVHALVLGVEVERRIGNGIAATQPVGLKEMFGTMTKSFHPGRATQNGLTAAASPRTSPR